LNCLIIRYTNIWPTEVKIPTTIRSIPNWGYFTVNLTKVYTWPVIKQ
jgi:hypothetical protein